MRLIKKPKFVRTDVTNVPGLKTKWRKPRGQQNKIRLHRRGKNKMPKIGFSNSNSLKFKIEKLNPHIIKNLKDLISLKKDQDIAVLSKSLGNKKRIEIIKKSIELDMKVANFKDLKLYLADLEKDLESRKEKKKAKQQEKSKTEETKKEPAKEEETKKEEKTEEEVKDKQEQDKKQVLEGK
ncbi:hypothetical protein CL617_04320 [archaeon]|nr:hypothetical protein [archaeon]|tara:strand:+ start:2148 stop:2690 length:543 start_codon:yes stop_codon:yes gene_type:complete